MAKVTAPLLSIGARGTVGKTITFASWKGVGYARQRVIPANPNTTGQQATRSVFKVGSDSWKTAPVALTGPWDAFASGRPLTGRNAYLGAFTGLLRGEVDLSKWQTSPGARSGQTVAGLAAVAGAASGEIDATYTLPPVPTGWTMEQVTFVTAKDQDPTDPWTNTIKVDDDVAMTGSFTIDSLDAATDYAVSAYIEWTRDDGKTAYGVSQTVIATSAV